MRGEGTPESKKDHDRRIFGEISNFPLQNCLGVRKFGKFLFWGGGGGYAVRFKYVFKGWGGVVQNNLKIGLAYTN